LSQDLIDDLCTSNYKIEPYEIRFLMNQIDRDNTQIIDIDEL